MVKECEAGGCVQYRRAADDATCACTVCFVRGASRTLAFELNQSRVNIASID